MHYILTRLYHCAAWLGKRQTDHQKGQSSSSAPLLLVCYAQPDTHALALTAEKSCNVHRPLAGQLHILQAQRPFARDDGDAHTAIEGNYCAWGSVSPMRLFVGAAWRCTDV